MAEVIENRGPQLLVIDYVFLFSAVIAMTMRCFVRCFIVKMFGLDDWLMLIATIFFILYCASSLSGVHYGTGRHMEDLEDMNIAKAKMFWWFCYLGYCMTMIFSKLSIGWFLIRVAARKMHLYIIYGAMAVTVITCLAFFLVTVFQCNPVSYFWDVYTQDGTCVSTEVIIGLGYLYSSCAVLSDFVFALLPAWIIYQLKMKARTKMALIPLMAMGCVASGAVIVRFAYFQRFRDPDFLWATLDVAIWSTVEQGLAITAGSLATLRPLMKIVGYKLGLTTKPSGISGADYGKMGASGNGAMRSGPISRRRGSQSAADNLKLDTFRSHKANSESKGSMKKAYEVSCEAGDKSRGNFHSPGGISFGKTYEISHEYVGQEQPSEKGSRRSSNPLRSPWGKKRQASDAESIEELHQGYSGGVMEGSDGTIPRSFLVDSERGR